MLSSLGKFNKLHRVKLAFAPTPLEYMPNCSRNLNGPGIFVKRDDMTGLALGGNKARQLEFYMGEAQARGADVILTTGAVQSNFVRTAAAAAAKLGVECHLQLEERVLNVDKTYRNSGNVLLEKLFGATLHSFRSGDDEFAADKQLIEIANELRLNGRNPYIISLSPGHPPLGAMGYIVCAKEILEQIKKLKISIDEIVCASGSASTHAGLVFGLRALGSEIRVIGICVRRSSDMQTPRVINRCKEIADFLEVPSPVKSEDIITKDETLAPGYGQLNKKTFEALKFCASSEGLVLDPVYTGKVFAGLISRIQGGVYAEKEKVLFLHTGGQPGLFAYEPKLRKDLT